MLLGINDNRINFLFPKQKSWSVVVFRQKQKLFWQIKTVKNLYKSYYYFILKHNNM